MTYKELYKLCSDEKLEISTKEKYFQPSLYGRAENYWLNLSLSPLDNEEILLSITLETFNSVEIFLVKTLLSKTLWSNAIENVLKTWDTLLFNNDLLFDSSNKTFNLIKQLAYG